MVGRKKEILQVGNKRISIGELLSALEQLQLSNGDVLCVHSQIFSLGKPLIKKEEFLECIVHALQEIIGKDGMLIMPTFSYSFCNKEVYDVKKTPSSVGLLTEYFRNMPGVYRTNHPIFSFALWGNRIEEYLDIGPDAFSLDSVYGKMIRDQGKILMLGANKGYTFYYLAEEHVNVSYRYFKNFSGEIIDASGMNCEVCVPYFVRDLSIKSEMDELKLSNFLLEQKCQQQIDFAKGTLAVINCEKTYSLLVKALKENEQIFL